MTGIIALHRALYHPESLILCLAPALRQSQELFGKVLAFYRALDRPVPARTERRLSLELENGSRIVTLPGTDKTIRGFSGTALLVVDEASRVADELYFAVRPMLAVSGGTLMMLSTPYGKRGVFFEEWTGGLGWERYEVPASQCPRISGAFLAEERRSLPEWVYRQEYFAPSRRRKMPCSRPIWWTRRSLRTWLRSSERGRRELPRRVGPRASR
jgi:hypothetical protein